MIYSCTWKTLQRVHIPDCYARTTIPGRPDVSRCRPFKDQILVRAMCWMKCWYCRCRNNIWINCRQIPHALCGRRRSSSGNSSVSEVSMTCQKSIGRSRTNALQLSLAIPNPSVPWKIIRYIQRFGIEGVPSPGKTVLSPCKTVRYIQRFGIARDNCSSMVDP